MADGLGVAAQKEAPVLLITALFQSMHGIAIRRRKLPVRLRADFEYYAAVVSDRGVVHTINGRNGTVRRISREDLLQDDWEPFQPKPATLRKIKKNQILRPINLSEEPPVLVKLPAKKKKPKKKRKPKPKIVYVRRVGRPSHVDRAMDVMPIAPPQEPVCARCEKPSVIRRAISMTKWLCEACSPRKK